MNIYKFIHDAFSATKNNKLELNMEEIKFEKLKNQLSAARAVIAETGKSPRQLGLDARKKIFDWIYRWGYTSSTIGQDLVNRTSGGYLQKLTNHDWLVSTKTKSGVPLAYFTLSEMGLQEAERHSDELCKYVEINQYRVDQLKIRHYLIAQKLTLNAIKSGFITDYETERMFAKELHKYAVKCPDAVWITRGGHRYGVEVELSAKWRMDLDMFIFGIVRALQSHENEVKSFSRFVIISDSPAIIRRYTNAMQPGQPLSIWEKSERGHWVVQTTINVPDWLIKKVDFKLIEG